jgi:hypothetical protein
MASTQDFEQIAGTQLYETPAASCKGWAAYLLPSGTLPDKISIDDSLNVYSGFYLFAWQRPPILDTDPASFVSAAETYLAAYGTLNRAAFWLQSVTASGQNMFGPMPAFGFQFSQNTQGYFVLQSNLNAALGSNLNFFVLSGLYLNVTSAGELIIATSSQQPSIGLQRGSSSLGLNIWDGNSQNIRIPTTGDNTGCAVFTGSFQTALMLGSKGIDCGLKFGCTPASQNGPLQTLSYPALNLSALPATLSCIGTLDPSDPTNALIASADLQQGYLRNGLILPGTPALPSSFRTSGGNPVTLLPVGAAMTDINPPLAAGGLAIASAALAGTPASQAPVYFAPTGNFALQNAADLAGTPEALLCGLFGSERITFKNYDPDPQAKNDGLLFIPSCKGYAPIFPFGTADLDNPTSGAVTNLLTSDVLAPWTTVVSGAVDVLYKAEPEGSGLYASIQKGTTLVVSGPPVLMSSPPSMPLAQGVTNTFPLVPYAGGPSGMTSDSIVQFESQIIARSRKSIVSKAASATWSARSAVHLLGATTPDLKTCATPQGFVAVVDTTTGAYMSVQMAQSTPEGASTPVAFAFEKPTQALQDALQTNQLFLIAVNPAQIMPPTGPAQFDNTVYMSGWTMTAAVGNGATPTSYKNVMIMKFCSGTVLERLGNPNRWTSPEEFSLLGGPSSPDMEALSYTGLSQWAQQYIQNAIDLVAAGGPSAPFYQDFVNTVTDKNWKGVLVLNADLPISSLPPEIAGLAAGIDFTRFAAHHFGVTVSRVAVDTSGVVSMNGNSSLFGLIDYAQPTFAQNLANKISPDIPIPVTTTDDFNFLVLQMQCLFRNSRLVEFNSYVQLTADSLFGSTVTQAYANGVPMPANATVLKGSYIDQNGSPSYIFQQTNPVVFTLDSNVLLAVAFNRVQFNTLGPRDAGQTMASRFLIWGAFDFAELGVADNAAQLLDLFSFGSPPKTPPPNLGIGLAFSNLVLDMTFPVATPNVQTMNLSTDKLAYDLASSQQRAGSLFAGFGLQLKSFLNISSTQTPTDLGFLTVQANINATELSPPWCGVVFQVTLGGPGALASAGGFNSNLLLAWSPNSKSTDTAQAAFVGLSLPGSAPGAKLFSLQGILKVSIDAIALQLQDVPGGGGAQFYCLRLDNIGLKVFGIMKLPSDANIQFFLFGDPANTGSLGWYAAWVADSTSGGKNAALEYEPLSAERHSLAGPVIEGVR